MATIGGEPRPSGVFIAARRVGHLTVFGLLPLVAITWWLTQAAVSPAGDWAFDFQQFWQGAHDVVAGDSPYPSRELLATADASIDGVGIRDVFRFPYPAPAAILLAPFGALPFEVATVVWAVLSLAAIVGAVRLLGVVDWRVYGVVIGSAPVIGAVRLGTLTPILLVLLAAAWRWRDRRWVAATALSVAVVLKMFLWPLLVWLVATRRFAEGARAALLILLGIVGGWAVIGFDGLRLYPELVRRLTEIVAERGFSLAAFAGQLGLPSGAARALPFVVAVGLIPALIWVGRRREGDRRAFSLAVIGAVAATPIVWLHYFTLLVVPLALARPRLAWAWGLMWIFWLTPAQESRGSLLQLAVAGVVVAAASACASVQRAPAAASRAT